MTHRPHETRAECVWRHILEARYAGRHAMLPYAVEVVMHYHATVPDIARTVVFRVVDGDYTSRGDRYWQQITRMLMAEVDNTRLPADLEESLVLCLPQPYRDRCIQALAARYNLLAVPIPDDTPVGHMASVADFTGAAGGVLSRLAEVLDDQVIDERDAEKAPGTLVAVDKAIGILQSIRSRLVAVTGLGGQ
ncbi:hypothetical protein JN531_012665 [Flagellatimonas centrodinii]|uniref:hypothetical protein n=1 Tax=Flagellatimonas centrodinii TaxID=2806210 RepID=UPI001FED7509|nr:hypothetical protein [Flagellatimonas centrodinii]ULQ45952.1 hypothetical protein JN531_012665 [Flagellatimonas centrodinii]